MRFRRNPELHRRLTPPSPILEHYQKFAQNFETFGLKRLVSTSYAFASKRLGISTQRRKDAEDAEKGERRTPRLCGSALETNGPYWQPTLFEMESPLYDAEKTAVRGKIFVLDRDAAGMEQYFSGLAEDLRRRILETKLTIYVCDEGAGLGASLRGAPCHAVFSGGVQGEG